MDATSGVTRANDPIRTSQNRNAQAITLEQRMADVMRERTGDERRDECRQVEGQSKERLVDAMHVTRKEADAQTGRDGQGQRLLHGERDGECDRERDRGKKKLRDDRVSLQESKPFHATSCLMSIGRKKIPASGIGASEHGSKATRTTGQTPRCSTAVSEGDAEVSMARSGPKTSGVGVGPHDADAGTNSSTGHERSASSCLTLHAPRDQLDVGPDLAGGNFPPLNVGPGVIGFANAQQSGPNQQGSPRETRLMRSDAMTSGDDQTSFMYRFSSWPGQPSAMVSFGRTATRVIKVTASDRSVFDALLESKHLLCDSVLVADDAEQGFDGGSSGR